MQQLDREKALEILELNPDATKDDVSRRYGILTRKFRNTERDERGYTIEDVTEAYNLLMGITYIDKAEEERQKALRENPPFLARILKVDPVKLENFFHYYKIHMIIGVVLIVFLFFTVRSCVTKVEPDFTIVCFGNVFSSEEGLIEEDIKQRIPGITAPSVQFLTSMAEDPQYTYTIQMKFVAMIAAKEVDIVIMDRKTFEMYMAQGMFLPLDDLIGGFEFPEESYVSGSEIIDETEDGEPVKSTSHIYGIDISDNKFIKDNMIYADSPVAAIVRNSERMDLALEFMRSLD